MPLSATTEQSLTDVNAMSDHEVQVAANLKLVSQNLQGPYAIKKSSYHTGPLYSFDIPEPKDAKDPKKLASLTGMSEKDCDDFIKANNNRDAVEVQKILKKNGLGEALGQGGFRLSLETDRAYEARMIKQVTLLKNIISGGSNVLSIQEQPYAGIDTRRSAIFARVMANAGYVSVAAQDQRDVGIWVKKELTSKSRRIGNSILGNTLISSVTDIPLRGCAAEVEGVLCINLHTERATNKETVDALLKLHKNAVDYSRSKTPRLKVSITGDMNLFQLDPTQKKRLEDNGFTLKIVKGQEKFAEHSGGKPTYEAFFEDKGLPKKSATLTTPAQVPPHSKPSIPSASSIKPSGLVPFQVDFQKNGSAISSRNQAIKILDEVARLHANGAKTVGITYSANQDQTAQILKNYKTGSWKTGTAGANQASVISKIEELLAEPKYQHLQGIYRTIPITTMKYNSQGQAVVADDASVKQSLSNASQFMANGGVLLGWRNQSTPAGQLAIGGGVAVNMQTATQKQMISHWVQSHLSPLSNLAQATPLTAPPLVSKWSKIRPAIEASDHAAAPPTKASCFTKSGPRASNSGLSLQHVEQCLQRGIIPIIHEGKTALDDHLLSENPSRLKTSANLLTRYSVKDIMGDLNTIVTVTMVDNTRSNIPRHDSTAMKIQFGSDAEAKIFSQKLLKEHGIHSLTFGQGVMKSPQNGAIYLTKEDLEKITAHSALTQTVGSGSIAYQVMANSHEKSKTYEIDVRDDDEDPLDDKMSFH